MTAQPPGKPLGSAGVAILAQRFDICEGRVFFEVATDQSLPTGRFSVTGNRDAASLQATVSTTDLVSGAPVTLTLNLQWKRTGDGLLEQSHGFFRTAGVSSVSFFGVGDFAPAQAVGTFTDGSTDFASAPSVDGSIGLLRSGTITIDKSLLLAASALPLAPSAPSGTSGPSRFRGQVASAVTSTTDPTGCIVRQVVLSASDHESTAPPQTTTETSEFLLSIVDYDVCADTYVLNIQASGSLAPGDFQMDRVTSEATLRTTVNATEYVSGAPVSLTLDVTWTGTGPVLRSMSEGRFVTPDATANFFGRGVNQPATVAGLISDGVTNYLSPAPNGFAFVDIASFEGQGITKVR